MTATYTAAVGQGRATNRTPHRFHRSVGRVDRGNVPASRCWRLRWRMRRTDERGREPGRAAAAAAPVNLNTVADTKAIDAAMATVVLERGRQTIGCRAAVPVSRRRTPEEARAAERRRHRAALRPAEFAKLKPLFTVRTADEFHRQVVLFACIYSWPFRQPRLSGVCAASGPIPSCSPSRI